MENQSGFWWKFAVTIRDEYVAIAKEKHIFTTILKYDNSIVPLIAKKLNISRKNVTRGLSIYNAGDPFEEVKSMNLMYIEPPKIIT